MKKIYVLLIGLLLSFSVISQECLLMGITFNTQQQIDNFQKNYPNCSVIMGQLRINGNGITNLNGLSVLTGTWSEVIIDDNKNLKSLYGLHNITTIGNWLEIKGNDSLTNLTGLNALVSLQWLWISDNNALVDLTGIDNLTTIYGDLFIYFNNSLTSIASLGNLTSVEGLLISFNPLLSNLTGLNNITSCSMLEIIDNVALTNLSALANINSVGDNFIFIAENDNLTSLTGLDNIDPGSITGLHIFDNISLSTCDVQSICDYLASPNGEIDIHDNATGCNSPEEVEAACGVGLDESAVGGRQSAVNIFPNPTSTTITLSTPTTPDKNTFMTIYNINGQQLITRRINEQQTVVNISALPQGIYFVKLTDDKGVWVGKVVKQ